MSLESEYVTVPDFAEECGVELHTVWNWINYWRYLETVTVLRRPVLRRTDCDRFKRKHPGLLGPQAKTEAVA